MVILKQDLRVEASLCMILHNVVVLIWKTGKYDHMTDEVPMAYIGEVNKKGKSQKPMELVDDA